MAASMPPEAALAELDTVLPPGHDEPALVSNGHRLLPFSFAKRHGVLIQGFENDRATTLVRRGADPVMLSEARRFIGQPLKVSIIEPAEFEECLQNTYERDSNSAMQMVEGFEETLVAQVGYIQNHAKRFELLQQFFAWPA